MNTWWKRNNKRFNVLAIKNALHMDKLAVQEIAELQTLQERRRKYQRNYICK